MSQFTKIKKLMIHCFVRPLEIVQEHIMIAGHVRSDQTSGTLN